MSTNLRHYQRTKWKSTELNFLCIDWQGNNCSSVKCLKGAIFITAGQSEATTCGKASSWKAAQRKKFCISGSKFLTICFRRQRFVCLRLWKSSLSGCKLSSFIQNAGLYFVDEIIYATNPKAKIFPFSSPQPKNFSYLCNLKKIGSQNSRHTQQ